MWRRVAADPNRVVPEPVQKENEGNLIWFELIWFDIKIFFWCEQRYSMIRQGQTVDRSIREKDATEM